MSYELPVRSLGSLREDAEGSTSAIVVTDLGFLHNRVWPLVVRLLQAEDRCLYAIEMGEDAQAEAASDESALAIGELRDLLLERNRA